jgi:hypothetical protein
MGDGHQTDGKQRDEPISGIFRICFTAAGVEKTNSEAEGLSVSPIKNVLYV